VKHPFLIVFLRNHPFLTVSIIVLNSVRISAAISRMTVTTGLLRAVTLSSQELLSGTILINIT
jgi:hypothetical protein